MPQNPHLTAHTNQVITDAQRKRDLGHIHQGKKALGWSEAEYRSHLFNLTEKDSASGLSTAERVKVLAFMADQGYKPKAQVFKPFDQTTKIKWLWKKIGEAGGLREATPQALLEFVNHHTNKGVSDVKFLPTQDASNVIEALKSMLNRADRAKAVDLK